MRPHLALLASLVLAVVQMAAARGQFTPYNPYAESQEPVQPLAADGTIRWGTFYKSAAMQKAYERLWNLGACRGTRMAIMIPVEQNKVIIDKLPESEFRGTVRGTAGTLAGGLVAFAAGDDPAKKPWIAALHPAGVSRLAVEGRAPATILKPGMHVRLLANVDSTGHAADPVTRFDIVTPSADFKPAPVDTGRIDTIVGQVRRIQGTSLLVHVAAGKLRRIFLNVAADAVATLDASQLELVEPGDSITVTGRLWSGEGAMGAGTIFASKVTITKPKLPAPPAPDRVSAGPPSPGSL